MPTFRRYLHDISYSFSQIRNFSILIVVFGLLMAFLMSTFPKPKPGLISSIYQLHLETLELQEQRERQPSTPSIPVQTRFQHLSNLYDWLKILTQGEPVEAENSIGIHFAIGLGHIYQGQLRAAIPEFEEENRLYPDKTVRRILLRTVYKLGDETLLTSYIENPDFAQEVDGYFLYRMGVDRMDWGLILGNFWKAQYQRLRMDVLFLALISGTIWTVLISSLYPYRWKLCWIPVIIGALALGWISTWPTIFSSIWLDTRFNLSEGQDFVTTFAYMLISVGVREELCKLLLYTPFLVYTLRKGRDTEALLLGALVGLGFAIEENITYFHRGIGATVIPRFTSANFLHFCLTGVTALALTRAIRDPNKWLSDSLQQIAYAIGLHAIYNTLLSQPIPGLGDMSYFSGTALVGCGYLFFQEASTLCPSKRPAISRTAFFIWGFCLLFNLEIVQASLLYPFREALALSGQAALASVLTGYIFLHFNRESLSE
jgi:RsiW-degrading membrane proteinase PrsW (M82 family)